MTHLYDDAAAPTRCPTVLLRAASEPLSRTWNQLARLGEFRGHPQGEFAFTAECFAQICANFSALRNGRIPLDYEHASETLPAGTAQNGVPAAGWIVAMEQRGDGLWGLIEWVDPQAVEYVRASRYRYLSPAVVFDAIDRESGQPIGARMTSAGLTNHPFLDGMAPLVASETAIRSSLAPDAVHIPGAVGPQKAKAMNEENLVKMRALFSMEGDADELAIIAKVEELMTRLRALEAAEAKRASDAADAVLASRTASKSLEGDARAKALALCMSDRATFDAFFPADPPAPVVVASETAPEPAPKAATPDETTLLTSRVTPESAPSEAADPTRAEADHSEQATELAKKLLSERPNELTTTTALLEASRQLRAAQVAGALSRLAGAPRS
jgi:phage I-like protein